MTAAWMWARADLRARWRSWLVLGLLAGVTFGLAAAGVAGARRADAALPRYLAAAGDRIDAAILPNDPAFDGPTRARIAALPEVRRTFPFLVAFALESRPSLGEDAPGLLPTSAAAGRAMTGVLVEGRAPDPDRPDEMVVDEVTRDRYGLDLGSSLVLAQRVMPELRSQLPAAFLPSDGDLDFRQRLHVVGVTKSVDDEGGGVTPSSGFARAYADRLVGPVNMFVALRGGEASFDRFRADVQEIVGHPVNVERGSELLRLRQVRNIADVERAGLLLFALAVVLVGGVLVGQALVRSVTAGAADVPTWRALGASRSMMVVALAAPAAGIAVVGAVVAIALAVAISPRLPIAGIRSYDVDVGIHADWLVLGLAVLGLAVAALGAAAVTAWWRSARGESAAGRPSTAGSWATQLGLPPALVVGSRLAVEPGRGRRAVPVRSALVGAIVGVLGVVGCLTFRAGISDTVDRPARSGIVWDSGLASASGPLDASTLDRIAGDPRVAAAHEARWIRAVAVDGVPTPTFGTAAVTGRMPLVVVAGRAPRGEREIAFAPSTLRDLDLRIGDTVRVGQDPGVRMTVVGTAFLPETPHTAYDQSAWMTGRALDRVLGPAPELGPNDVWDFALVRWRAGVTDPTRTRVLAALAGDGYFPYPATLPTSVTELGRLRVLPAALAVFFALLAVATVAHALVTTVRRRRHDLAIMRAFGFTARQSRVAVAWQATLLGIVGLVVGVPLGLVTGRVVWRSLAHRFPVVYVPPIALVAVVVVVPLALAVVNAIAVGPGRAAARIRPAEALRVE